MNDRYVVISPETLEAMRRAGHAAKLEARIEKLEAENKKLKNGMWEIIGLCKWGIDRTPSFCAEPEGCCHCMKAFNALDYDFSNEYLID